MRAIRNGLQAAGIPVENSKGEWGPGQEEINVRYAEALEMADRHVILKNGVQGDRLRPQGKAVTFMAKWDYGAGRLVEPHPPVAVGRRRQEAAVLRPEGRARHVDADAPVHGAGSSNTPREITWFLAPYINSYKRFQAGTFAPTKSDLEPRQPHRRLPPVRRGHQGASASNAASAAPTSTPISPSPR